MSATTPHGADMTTPYSPSKTPSRRVLGDLNPKAINTPSTQQKAFESSEVARAQSPLKQVTNYATTGFVNKENYTTPITHSKNKKRGIDEVEAAETAEHLKMLARDANRIGSGMQLTSDAMQRHTENNPIGLADPGSPTERATPSPEPEPLASQRSNQSFSDFLNYDQCASQKSEHATTTEHVPTSVPALAPAPIIVEEKKKKSKAELLRTRLNFGFYKIKTNQVNKRDIDIISNYEASISHATDALNASRSALMAASASSLSTPRVPNITVSSPRHAQSATFVQANLDPFRPIGKLGAAPVLFAPPSDNTQVSSHILHHHHKYDISSSPPQVSHNNSLTQSVSPNQLMSPAQTPLNTYANSRIRMGEHDVGDVASGPVTAHQRLQRLKEQQYRESEMSSNAVKGNAAAGLLELMRGQT